MPRSLLSMRWDHVCFAHWAVDPAVVAPTLPDGLTVDTREALGALEGSPHGGDIAEGDDALIDCLQW